MSKVTIYHNPACGTSRNTLGLIRNAGIEPTIIEYLEHPPSREQLAAMIKSAGLTVREALRQKEALYMPAEFDRRQMLLAAIAASTASTLLSGFATPASAETSGAEAEIPDSALLEPGELAQVLGSGKDHPLVFQVGVRFLYEQAHIPGAEYIGATEGPAGLAALRHRVAKLNKSQPIVIYCGCCPWSRCPNIRPAFRELHTMGFTQVKALQIANNFGADWTDKGYPVEHIRQPAN